MRQLIEQLANELNIDIDKVNEIFIAFQNRLLAKIPALQPVIEAVFDNEDDDALKHHIRKLIIQLEKQQCESAFGAWNLPPCFDTLHMEQGNGMF